MALVSMNFGLQNCGAVPGCLPSDQIRRGWSKIITIFQWVLIFEQSVNRRRRGAPRDQDRAASKTGAICAGDISRC